MSEAGSISVGLALPAGLVSFLSPCVLPLAQFRVLRTELARGAR